MVATWLKHTKGMTIATPSRSKKRKCRFFIRLVLGLFAAKLTANCPCTIEFGSKKVRKVLSVLFPYLTFYLTIPQNFLYTTNYIIEEFTIDFSAEHHFAQVFATIRYRILVLPRRIANCAGEIPHLISRTRL